LEIQRLGGRGRGSLRRRLAQIQKEPLGATSRGAEDQEPAGLRPDVLIGVRGAAGNVDEGARPPREGAAVADEFVLAFEDIEGLVLLVVQVGSALSCGAMASSKSVKAPPVSSPRA
jgi:hypothetical protein